MSLANILSQQGNEIGVWNTMERVRNVTEVAAAIILFPIILVLMSMLALVAWVANETDK